MGKLLEVKELRISFCSYAGEVQAVRGVSFSVEEGEPVAIVGESGCGKSVTAKAVMGLIRPPQGEIKAGSEIIFDGKNILEQTAKQWREYRGKDCAIVFQDALAALNPTLTVGRQIVEKLLVHTDMTREEARREAVRLLEQVGIPEAGRRVRQYPHEFSGGMRQRIMIAAALVTEPKLLIADEPTTALDVTIQSQILKLLKKINEKHHTGILFISHDLGVIRRLCDRVIVMNQGKIVEMGTVEEIFQEPRQEYTKKLLAAVPTRGESLRRRKGGEAQ